jgi:hypothetical protein
MVWANIYIVQRSKLKHRDGTFKSRADETNKHVISSFFLSHGGRPELRQSLPAKLVQNLHPHFSGEQALDIQVVRSLRLLVTKNTRYRVLQTMLLTTFGRPAPVEHEDGRGRICIYLGLWSSRFLSLRGWQSSQ